MKTRITILAAVTAAAICVGYWKWTGRASFGAGQPNPRVKVAATIALDLLRSAGEPIDLFVASGERFTVVLRNRTPGKTYRVQHDTLLGPDNPYRSQLKDLHAKYELAPDGEAPPRGQTLLAGDELRVSVIELEATGSGGRTWTFSVHPPRPARQWAYADEEHWIVSITVQDIVDTLRYAAGAPALATDAKPSVVALQGGDPGAPSYTVNVPMGSATPLTHTLTFPEHVWSPRTYAPLAAELMQALALHPAGGSADASRFLQVLVDPRSGVLERESQRISRALAGTPLDRGAHEEAALLVGTLAFRETSGRFSDTRHALSRMAAHLSLAAALRAGAPESRLAGSADALLLTLVNRQTDALARIDGLEAAGSGGAFLRALRLRITHDWRLLRNPRTASLLERLEAFRAFERSAGSSRAMQFLGSFPAEPMSDWPRIAYASWPSVEEGNTFGGSTAALEIKDLRETWRMFHGSDLLPENFAEAMNTKPGGLVAIGPDGRTPMLRVIGWGTWGRFFQRNLCFEVEAEALFLHRGLGAPEEGQDYRKAVYGALSGLQLTPVLELAWAEPGAKGGPLAREGGGAEELAKAKLKACRAAADLTQGQPELLTARPWRSIETSCYEERRTQALAPASGWFKRGVPLGTALFDKSRVELEFASKPDLREVCLKLHPLAPYDSLVIVEIMPASVEDWRLEDLSPLYGPLAEYDLNAMLSLVRLSLDDPARARALYAKIAPLSPETYLELGDYLVDLGLDREAAATYEDAVAHARDRVAVSHDMHWLVGYYCDLGRLVRAREIAQMAGNVGSEPGLATMGYLMERLGKFADAEQWYTRIFQQYGRREDLDEFYFRAEHRLDRGRFVADAGAAAAAAATTHLFPAGLERFTMDEAKSALGSSVKVDGRSHAGRRFGLVKGDQVVALNGYRVRDYRQYQCIWTLTDDGEDSIIVWRNDRHIELKGRMRRIRYDPVSSPGRARI